MDAQEKRIAGVWIRWLIRRDMPEVLEIENRSFQNPWTHDDFIACLRQRSVIGVVAESKGKGSTIFWFMLYELHGDKLVLLNFAVAPEVRRTGVGLAMAQRLIDNLAQQRRRLITAETSEENLPAQLFFADCGFKANRCVDGQIKFQYVLTGSFPEWQGVNRMTECEGL